MRLLERIEEACAAFVERAFAKTFHSALEPSQVARKLVATMEAQRVRAPRGTQTARRYLVHVSAEDYDRLAPHRAFLEREWSALLTDMARRVHMEVAAPVVCLERDLEVVDGSVRIEAAPLAQGELNEAHAIPIARALQMRVAKGVPLNASIRLVGSVTIGRDKDNDLVLSDPGVSRHHARVETAGGACVLRDLHSTNGSFLNGGRVEQARIGSGDVVVLGSTRLCVEEAVG